MDVSSNGTDGSDEEVFGFPDVVRDDINPNFLMIVLASLADVIGDFNPHVLGVHSLPVPVYHNLFMDTLVRVTRDDEQSNQNLPPAEFKPTKFTENEITTLPVLFTRKNILPSDVFSQMCNHETEYKQLIRITLEQPKWTFAVSRKLNEDTSTIGFTAEIFRKTGPNGSLNFTVFWMVHQMCEILSLEPFPGFDGTSVVAMAKIKIIPPNLSLYPYQKLSFNMRNQYSRVDRCLQTPWPKWVYKQVNPVNLVSQLVAKVKLLYPDINLIFTDPYLLSFDVLKLNIFTEDQKQYLQDMKSTYQRIYDEIQSIDNLVCYGCKAVVTSIDDVFTMPRVRYRNHNRCYYNLQNVGVIYTTKLNVDYIIMSDLTSRFCLHRGYKWQDLTCKSCSNRLGWRYFTTQQSIKSPKIFYGLKRSAITSTKSYLPKHLIQTNQEPRGDEELIGYRLLIQD